MISVGRLTRAVAANLDSGLWYREMDLFVVWWTWPVKMSEYPKRTLEVMVVFGRGGGRGEWKGN